MIESHIFERITAEHQDSCTYTRTYELAKEGRLAGLMPANYSNTVKNMMTQDV